MVFRFIILLLIAIGLFTASGWVCYNDNEFVIMVRDAFGLEKGCVFREQLINER